VYQIKLHKQASKKLKSLNTKDRLRVVDKIVELSQDPDSSTLDIKKLIGEPFHRLRAGNWRIIFHRDDILKILTIEKIKPRGDVYK